MSLLRITIKCKIKEFTSQMERRRSFLIPSEEDHVRGGLQSELLDYSIDSLTDKRTFLSSGVEIRSSSDTLPTTIKSLLTLVLQGASQGLFGMARPRTADQSLSHQSYYNYRYIIIIEIPNRLLYLRRNT